MKKVLVIMVFFSMITGIVTMKNAICGETVEKGASVSSNDTSINDNTPVTLNDMQVTGTRVELSPLKTEVFMEDYNMATHTTNILDILKDRAIIDFRAQSDLVPEDDVIQMRGFDTRQFITSVDGLVIQKTGGFWGGHYVDFGTIPYSIVESIEIISGPHSALFDGKGFGGVINFKTKTPKYYDEATLDGSLSASLRSYNTNNQMLEASGGVKKINMGFSYERYHTDGYLRNNTADIDNLSGRVSFQLPNDGYMRLMGTYSDISREIPTTNDPERDDFDSSYPIVKTEDVSSRWQNPEDHSKRDYGGHTVRFDLNQPSKIGKFSLGAYYTDEDQEYFRDGFDYSRYTTNYVSYGGIIKHEMDLFDSHTITTGLDTANLYTKYTQEIVDTSALFIQDKWDIMEFLTLTAGLRYEDTSIWWNNWWSPSATYPDGAYKDPSHPEEQVKKDYNQVVPKSLLTWQMEQLSPAFKGMSLSLGVSKIWSPRSYCEVCSWGSGVELEPAEGMGYDLIFSGKILKNIFLNVDFSRYDFSDYPIWANAATDYFKEAPWGRRMVSLEDVVKDGVDIEINGFFGKTEFYTSYAFNEWKYEGPHNGGPEEWADADLSDRAKHRLNAGIRYRLFAPTLLLVDYKFQSEQTQQVIEMVDDDPSDLYVREASLDDYSLVDIAVEQTLFTNWRQFKKGTVKLYATNIFDEEYSNSRGYPMTDRTYGVSMNFSF
ncbi:conserved hypothetical protein [Desulfamplus magnetovallimortis]|uniref:TonB-dependent receptor n=1 Tax=Desulfamplus magnetovallimortis TaxID=1246637 RepID=A0A1W1HHE4_9BACT|nr:TonB-dependent receptor [Desulfamplus magnetovallimortis]SLM31899.1 conserved hypothetical protein [Desulfamplus magnetovallimortis]